MAGLISVGTSTFFLRHVPTATQESIYTLPSSSRNRASNHSRPQPSHNSLATAKASTPAEGALLGTVVRSHGLWHEVKPAQDDDAPVIIATLRGQLKRRRKGTDVVAVGDKVWFRHLPDNEAIIELVEPRTRTLGRTARHTRDVEQVILANPDQVFFVFAVHHPEPHVRMLDRFIILAELQEIPIQIIITKMDLDGLNGAPLASEVFQDYRETFPLHFVSTQSGEGMDELLSAMAGRVSAVAGPSGVGKSSLLNILDPDAARDTKEVSTATGKGKHTTVGARLHTLGGGTFVADTPGMRSLAMAAVDPLRLDWCYREFRPFLGDCFYGDCTHIHEPDCAVRRAVAEARIPVGRYESYVSLRRGDELQTASDTW